MPAFATVSDVAAEYTPEYVAELATGAADFDPADPADEVSVKIQGNSTGLGPGSTPPSGPATATTTPTTARTSSSTG